jgi:hypothetical protein
MRVVGFITQAPVIRKILDHVGRRFEPLVLSGREMRKKKIPISGCGSFAWPGFLQDGDVHGHPLLLEWRCETTPVTCRQTVAGADLASIVMATSKPLRIPP